jgi:hypothetical protein
MRTVTERGTQRNALPKPGIAEKRYWKRPLSAPVQPTPFLLIDHVRTSERPGSPSGKLRSYNAPLGKSESGASAPRFRPGSLGSTRFLLVYAVHNSSVVGIRTERPIIRTSGFARYWVGSLFHSSPIRPSSSLGKHPGHFHSRPSNQHRRLVQIGHPFRFTKPALPFTNPAPHQKKHPKLPPKITVTNFRPKFSESFQPSRRSRPVSPILACYTGIRGTHA